jgi:phage tail-like protein
MSNYYPPIGFHFKVEITSFGSEYQFQSVSGLNVELETEELAEGGVNQFKHKLPVRSKFPNLVLSRGLKLASQLRKWVANAIENLEIEPLNLTIHLMNEKHEPLMTWNVIHAFPVKWSVSDLNAEEGKIVIESLELTYQYFNIPTNAN